MSLINVLITGVAGFIGSNLCEHLLKNNFNVIGVDNFDPFYSEKIKMRNMINFKNHNNFNFVECDIFKDISPLSNLKFEIVIHLAGKAGVISSITDIESYLSNNVIGTKNILELMRKSNCDKIIFSSSSSVYGSISDKKLKEECLTDFPLTPYATSKKTCELLLYNYHNIYNFKVIALRLFSVYGKKQRPDLAFSKFSRKILNNETIEIYGNGDSSRDYTEISDVLNSIELSINYLLGNHKVYEIFNIGNSNSISIQKVVNDLSYIYNKTPIIKYIENHKGDMLSTCADISKAQNLLHYQPNIPYEIGLKMFTEWYTRNNYIAQHGI